MINDSKYPLPALYSEWSWNPFDLQYWGIYVYLTFNNAWEYIGSQFIWPLSGGDYSFGLDLDIGEERPLAGSWFMFVFGFAVELLMLNLLIAMMSSTYEAVMEDASLNFKTYKAQRVIEYRYAPRLPPYLFMFVLVDRAVGWILRCTGVIDGKEYPLRAGWHRRPAFFFDDSKYKKPEEADLRAAEKAVESALAQMKEGGWETSIKSAQKRAKRMSRERDGVATRESVHYIVRANLGDALEETNARFDAITETNARFDARFDAITEANARIDARIDSVEHQLELLNGSIATINENMGTIAGALARN